ncbi:MULTISPECIES: hypothetical protein [Desulfosediminicola]|uniref:hypothetical protein n=1 Tax=Desulfosediminicola TaxID=2886823 RepID=UPI0010ABD3C4|nr:hypothetical protein [Desulfosediminicola ganghwensis]
MTTKRPTELPGDKLRKAIDEYSQLRTTTPELSANATINKVAQKFDLSPIECEFLRRQLLENS